MEKNKDFDILNASHEEYDVLFHRAVQEYAGLLNADDPDLTEFKNAGGKLISYHGMVRVDLNVSPQIARKLF